MTLMRFSAKRAHEPRAWALLLDAHEIKALSFMLSRLAANVWQFRIGFLNLHYIKI